MHARKHEHKIAYKDVLRKTYDIHILKMLNPYGGASGRAS
jgi:hypothetical protein